MFFRSIKGSDYDQVYRNMTTARIKMYPPQMITVRIKMYPPCREYSTKRAEWAAMEKITWILIDPTKRAEKGGDGRLMKVRPGMYREC